MQKLLIYLGIIFSFSVLAGYFTASFFIAKNFDSTIIADSFPRHYSFYAAPDFFDAAFKKASAVPSIGGKKIIAATVNHHLFASQLIAQIFNGMATDKEVTIVLLSPNHFSHGQSNAIVSNAEWQTPYGILKPNSNFIQKITTDEIAQIDEKPFETEHGISGLVAFIKKTMPHAKIVPLIVKDGMTAEQAKKMAEYLDKNLPQDAVLVGSFDFTHEQVAAEARARDQESLKVMRGFLYDDIRKVNVDSLPGLLVVMRYAEMRGGKEYMLLANTNSGDLTGDSESLTTSYIDGYFLR